MNKTYDTPWDDQYTQGYDRGVADAALRAGQETTAWRWETLRLARAATLDSGRPRAARVFWSGYADGLIHKGR